MSQSGGQVYLGRTRSELQALCEYLSDPAFTKAALKAEKNKRNAQVGRLGFVPKRPLLLSILGIKIRGKVMLWHVIDGRNPQWNEAQLVHINQDLAKQPDLKHVRVISDVAYLALITGSE